MTKNKITKFKLFLDLDKEVEYINEMNRKGWKLVYIKGGCLYTFVKTEPDEYFTVLHAECKEKISEVTAFAAQCGYESIPHTMDGFGDLMYLTGKKSEVSEVFASDFNVQTDVIKRIHKKFFVMSVIMAVIDVILILESLLFILITFIPEFDPVIAPVTLVFTLISIVMCIPDIFMFSITFKYKKKLKALKNDALIYE